MNLKTHWAWNTLLTGLLCLSALAATEEKLQKTFDAKTAEALVVDVSFGVIEVSTKNGSEVAVAVHRTVTRRTKSQEEQFFKENPVLFSAEQGRVTVRSPGKPERQWSVSNSAGAHYTISVPPRYKVDLRTAGGRISVKGTQADVRVRTSGGGLNFEGIRGGIDGHTSGGGMSASRCEGRLQLRTSGGKVGIKHCAGELNAETSGGSIDILAFKGPVQVRTSGGHIEVRDVTGSLDCRTSGGHVRTFLAAVRDPVDLETSGGDVVLEVPEKSSFELNAVAGAGTVQSDLPVLTHGDKDRNHLSGKVNDGGPNVRLRTSGGHIKLRKR